MSNFSHMENNFYIYMAKSQGEAGEEPEEKEFFYASRPIKIDHISILSKDLDYLFINGDFCDITLVVEEEKIKCHRMILASRSEYFRALLYGGLKETEANEIKIHDVNVFSFKSLLRYIYSGQIDLYLSEEQVIDLLGLAHKFFLRDLENAIALHLKDHICINNFCTLFNVAQMYEMAELNENCLQFADYNACDVLSDDTFVDLTLESVKELARRDSFYAPEIEIFKAVKRWLDADTARIQFAKQLLSNLRLVLIQQKDLLDIVRPSGLLSSDDLLDAINEQQSKRSSSLVHRGCKIPNINVACVQQAAKVLKGDANTTFLGGDFKSNTNTCQEMLIHTRHAIGDSGGIVIELGKNWIINTLRIHLPDREPKMYSYFVEVSVDNNDWLRVIDYSNYPCRGHQNLIFAPRAVRFIKIVGVSNTMANKHFHVTAIEAMYSTDNIYKLPPSPFTDIAMPTDNIATIGRFATVIEGVSRSRNALLNGTIDGYDWDTGYTCHQLRSGSITVQLPQPFVVESMRILLWDCDDRYYSYYVEVSMDQKEWITVVDRRADECRSWQLLKFPITTAIFVRITGVHNSANEVFHIVHFECPASDQARTGEEVFVANPNSPIFTEASAPVLEDEEDRGDEEAENPKTEEEFIPEENRD